MDLGGAASLITSAQHSLKASTEYGYLSSSKHTALG